MYITVKLLTGSMNLHNVNQGEIFKFDTFESWKLHPIVIYIMKQCSS